MSGKPTVVFTRLTDWVNGGYSSDVLNLVYVQVGGVNPRKHDGSPIADGIGDMVTDEGRQDLLKSVKKYEPEILLHFVHRRIGTNLMTEIKRISPKTLIVVADGNQPHAISAYVKKHRKYIDGVLLNSSNAESYAKYNDLNYKPRMIGKLCDGFVPVHHELGNVPIEHDCYFAGSNLFKRRGRHEIVWRFPNSKNRNEFIVAAKKKFDLIVHANEGNWPFPVKKILQYPEFYRAFHKAKISLGMNQFNLTRYYTRRLIHGGASSSLYITGYIPGMEKDFENHVNMAWFHTIEEGLELIEYYLNNDKEREKVAKQQRKHFLKHHSWEARLKEFEKYAKKILK